MHSYIDAYIFPHKIERNAQSDVKRLFGLFHSGIIKRKAYPKTAPHVLPALLTFLKGGSNIPLPPVLTGVQIPTIHNKQGLLITI